MRDKTITKINLARTRAAEEEIKNKKKTTNKRDEDESFALLPLKVLREKVSFTANLNMICEDLCLFARGVCCVVWGESGFY
jgi:hypothetical protein